MNIWTLDLLATMGITPTNVMQMAFGAMTAALFLQSGLDKLFNWKGEKAYLTGHFEKSILRGMVPIAMPLITLLELGAGSLSAVGFFQILFVHSTGIGLLCMVLAVKALFLLFLGQRIAKDYAGAASLVPYFLMCAAGLYFFMAG